MTVLYKLAKEQLSKQHHYDFGLRALKSVLVMAGELKRGSPDLTEDIVLMRALRDMNMPKWENCTVEKNGDIWSIKRSIKDVTTSVKKSIIETFGMKNIGTKFLVLGSKHFFFKKSKKHGITF